MPSPALPGVLYNTNGNLLTENDVQQDLTVNNDLGSRLSLPMTSRDGSSQSTLSGGFDFKMYSLVSAKTNIFYLNGKEVDSLEGTTVTNVNISTNFSPVPTTFSSVQYLPISLRYDESEHDSGGVSSFGLGFSLNPWHSGSLRQLQAITESTKSTGHWVVVTPSFSRDFYIRTNWVFTLHADGQVASEPLISNEQFGAGGVASVRGYHEGEVFGDDGWHLSLEQKTPPHNVGIAFGNTPLIVRGSIYTDAAQVFLIDPLGRPGNTTLWSVGVGGVASLGSHFEVRLLFSLPMLGAGTIEAYQPAFDFALTAQF
jgi:hemolysin activation/secretion protein